MSGRARLEPERAPAPVSPAVRAVLYLAALLVLLAGVQLFVFPLRTDRYFAWTIANPMTAVFLGASYWSAMALELSAARAARWSDSRIALPAVFVFTVLTLVVTLVHLELFHFGAALPLNTRVVTWAWLAIYVLVPILLAAAWLAQRARSTAVPPAAGLPTAVRLVLVALAAVLLGVGAALLVAPTAAAVAWPWALTPLTGRAVGAWLVGLGTAAVHARLVDDRRSLRALGVTGVTFGVLQAVALARHGDRLDWTGVPAAGYLLALVTLTAVSAWLLLPAGGTRPPAGGRGRRRSRGLADQAGELPSLGSTERPEQSERRAP